MSAAEIIEQIKQLSPEEQREVFGLVHELEDHPPVGTGQSVKASYLDQQSFDAAAKWAVQEHRELLGRLAK